MIQEEHHHFLKHQALGIILLLVISENPKLLSFLVLESDC
jgi:hypothetical protein